MKLPPLHATQKNEAWGRLLEFDDMDGTHHTWAMPMELLKGDGVEYRGALLSMGLQIAASGKARNLLTQYIQTAQVEQRARCVDRTGWHGSVFVMPDRSIGEDEERILFQSAGATPGTFRQKNKLFTWQANVAALCAGNSRLVFAVSAAFAAPLLHMTGMGIGWRAFSGRFQHWQNYCVARRLFGLGGGRNIFTLACYRQWAGSSGCTA
ncbi:MAG: DUF927 domain-containing protein [Nitrosomonadales bacterium]